MPSLEELEKSAIIFVQEIVPSTVQRFADPDGHEHLKTYYFEHFAPGAEQRYNIKGLSTKYMVITKVKDNYEKIKSNDSVKLGRYKKFIVRVLEPITVEETENPRIRVKASLEINGVRQSDIEYVLKWDSKSSQWQILTSIEAEVEPHHLAWDGILGQTVASPTADSVHLVQRLLYFKRRFEGEDGGRALSLKGKLRHSPEIIEHAQLQSHFWSLTAWSDTYPEFQVPRGRPDIVLRRANALWAIEIKTDNSAKSLVKALREKRSLDDQTKRQIEKYFNVQRFEEIVIVLFHGCDNLESVYCELLGPGSPISAVCIRYNI